MSKHTVELERYQWRLIRRALRDLDSKVQDKLLRFLNSGDEIKLSEDWQQWHEEDIQEHLELMHILDKIYEAG